MTEYNISSFSIHTSNKIETSKGYKFSISEAIGNWQDNKGNYGKSKIIFYVEEFERHYFNKRPGRIYRPRK